MPHNSPPAPIFIAMDGGGDSHLTPFYEGSPPKPGEAIADIMVRYQIRRSAAFLGRELTEEEEECIRSSYRETGRCRAPSEDSEPASEHSPTSLAMVKRSLGSFSASGGNGNDATRESSSSLVVGTSITHTANEKTTDHLRRQADQLHDAIEARLKATEKQLASEQRLLGSACADIAQLKLERQATEKKLAALEKELRDAKAELNEIKQRSNTAGEEAEDEFEPEIGLDADGDDSEDDQSLRSPDYITVMFVVFAIVVLVWVATEATLHGKGMTDGFGPYINGGYNGLGSALIFGSWIEFLLFSVALVYLGTVSISATLGP